MALISTSRMEPGQNHGLDNTKRAGNLEQCGLVPTAGQIIIPAISMHGPLQCKDGNIGGPGSTVVSYGFGEHFCTCLLGNWRSVAQGMADEIHEHLSGMIMLGSNCPITTLMLIYAASRQSDENEMK